METPKKEEVVKEITPSPMKERDEIIDETESEDFESSFSESSDEMVTKLEQEK